MSVRAREKSTDSAARFLEMRAERTVRNAFDALREAIVSATSPEALTGWPWQRNQRKRLTPAKRAARRKTKP